MSFPVVEIPPDASTQLEQLGTKAKFWYRAADGRRMLFKQGRPNTGENWAEKLCCEIARLLGLPHAEYDFAHWRDREGVTTPSIVPKDGRLIHGNELLAAMLPGQYDETKRFQARQHTLFRVLAVLRAPNIETPVGWERPPEAKDAIGTFIGYLLLDALARISHQGYRKRLPPLA